MILYTAPTLAVNEKRIARDIAKSSRYIITKLGKCLVMFSCVGMKETKHRTKNIRDPFLATFKI